MDQTVVLSDVEWGQLVAIIANATGYATFQKLVMQLQEQQAAQPVTNYANSPRVPGDGIDADPPPRRVPLR